MRRISTAVVKVFAVANVVFAIIGICLFVYMSMTSVPRFAHLHDIAPFALHVYVADAVIVAVLLGGLVYCAVCLLRAGASAVRMARVIYFSELLYFLVSIFVVRQLPLSQSWHDSILTGQVAWVSLMPQVLTGYPVVALIVMTLLMRRTKASTAGGTAGSPLVWFTRRAPR